MTFDQLLKLVTPTLRQVAFFNNLNKQDSEDVIQETLLSLWKKWSSGKIDSSQNIVGYASQLMNWRARDRNRKR
jgi:DNA-directed RNA polymerase specialized sigma24 family protein